ncbi:damage-control phosphatase ARMT1 family protein [Beduini massiliensis]|uniref:damage-control phosphatase ARMT1 family protein n=1 Tax=Beduini massiliensis TaxID=1585974 RepID=UPI00059A7AFA|nr:ARMT1-like domain-containing protein [Beduini massiliensis]
MNKACFECDRQQMLKISRFLNLEKQMQEKLLTTADSILTQCDMSKTNPEIMAGIWEEVTQILGNKDPYEKVKQYYNTFMMSMSETIRQEILNSNDPFLVALKIAITGNLIDFAAKHTFNEETVQEILRNAEKTQLAIDDSAELKRQLGAAKTLLYLGDNCGEIVLDKLFIEWLKTQYPDLTFYYGVRGKPIVNDVTLKDAADVHMEEVATVISNGDGALGTVLKRTSPEFQKIFDQADLVLCKGQGNYEGLLGNPKENLFFMFMAKCELVAQPLGVQRLGIVCLKNRKQLKWGD